MLPRRNERRLMWLGLGLIAGIGLAYVWPHETAQAVATDRIDDKFAICTVETQTQFGQPEAVFVLDFLTGRLTGALLNQQSFAFTNFWFRNVAADFNLKPNAAAKAKYAIIPGNAYLTSGGGETMSTGCIYIGELSSGKVVCYSFAVRNSKTPLPVAPLEPVAFFPFREQIGDN
jgi:hypothetical protein